MKEFIKHLVNPNTNLMNRVNPNNSVNPNTKLDKNSNIEPQQPKNISRENNNNNNNNNNTTNMKINTDAFRTLMMYKLNNKSSN